MEKAHHALTYSGFDGGPVLDMYFAYFDAWKKSIDAFTAGSKWEQKQQAEAQSTGGDLSATAAQLQSAGENIVRRVAGQQMELCRFFGKRWEQYLSLPASL